jgi:hypothetical protein
MQLQPGFFNTKSSLKLKLSAAQALYVHTYADN